MRRTAGNAVPQVALIALDVETGSVKALVGGRDYREALAESLNIPAVKVVEIAGDDEVAKFARAAGLDLPIPATPAIALGAYETTPLSIAGAHTLFARQGVHMPPNWIARIRDRTRAVVFDNHPAAQKLLDPRVAYLVTALMEEVLRSGTGASVRSRGFTLPAAVRRVHLQTPLRRTRRHAARFH